MIKLCWSCRHREYRCADGSDWRRVRFPDAATGHL